MTGLDAALAAAVAEAVRPLVDELRALREEVAALRTGDADKLLSVEEAADVLGISADALRGRIARRTVAVVRVGSSVRIRRGSLVGETKKER